MQQTAFAQIKFRGQLRPSQVEVVELAKGKLAQHQRSLHIVAPPGSGKTVLGLYLWAECVRRPALVLSPNSAIQAQWAQRVSLFEAADSGPNEAEFRTSTSAQSPGLLTSLTYQSVSLTAPASQTGDLAATSFWVNRLLDSDHADSEEAANAWIDDLRHRSPEYFKSRLSAYRKMARENAGSSRPDIEHLHPSSKATIQRLIEANVGMIILDECHHLMGHWGRAVEAIASQLDQPVVLGLTATPPGEEDYPRKDVQRYRELLGEIDYEVPVPAVVRDGFLAPYQDLAWFVRPTEQELAFVADVDRHFRSLMEELCAPQSSSRIGERVLPLPNWIAHCLQQRQLGSRQVDTWKQFHSLDTDFADSGRAFLHGLKQTLPSGVPNLHSFLHRWRKHVDAADLPLDVLTVVLDRYIRHGLRRGSDSADRALCEKAINQLRLLGIQITEVGHQKCASPITRVLGYTRSKVDALIPILECELDQLEDDLRAVVISDFEKSSAVSAKIVDVLDEEAGGAVSAFRTLVAHPATNTLDPVLMTGSTILVDHDLADLFKVACRHWLTQHNHDVQLELEEEDGFFVVSGKGRDWCPRVYIQMVTHLFQDGITRCLIGTRGLLAEGWDANRINVLIDLTTVTTSMTVNQLRGRSIRLDPQQPEKVANNWDVTCLAPEFTGGLDDYHRLCRKHDRIYGVTDDGAVEKGIGHVHAALSDMHSGEQEHDFALLNHDMLRRAADRSAARKLWKIGNAYSGQPVRCVEFREWIPRPGESPLSTNQAAQIWSSETLSMAISTVVLRMLQETGQIGGQPKLRRSIRDGGYSSIHLESSQPSESEAFAKSLSELLAPFERPRYIIPLIVRQYAEDTGNWIQKGIGRLFTSRKTITVCYYQLPAFAAKSKELADAFQMIWNDLVSQGDTTWCRKGEGRDLLNSVIENQQMPQFTPRIRDCFL